MIPPVEEKPTEHVVYTWPSVTHNLGGTCFVALIAAGVFVYILTNHILNEVSALCHQLLAR